MNRPSHETTHQASGETTRELSTGPAPPTDRRQRLLAAALTTFAVTATFAAAFWFGSVVPGDGAGVDVGAAAAASQSRASNAQAMTRPGPAAVAAHAGGGLDPQQSRQIAALEQAVQADPADLAPRRRLARALVEAEQYMPAYQQASELLRSHPDDAEALYVLGAVRLRMGRTRDALTDLSRAIASDPEHVDALLAYGLAQLRIGDSGGAVATWSRGLAAAGGEHPELQRLLAVSRAARAEKQRQQAAGGGAGSSGGSAASGRSEHGGGSGRGGLSAWTAYESSAPRERGEG
ncbi:MAG: hypothetical protein DWQ36_25365 [Acidobacteria bacterium]|nr:MAG: hypothetical protein DWQ36_25365 [Acidobacteriota bacterium]